MTPPSATQPPPGLERLRALRAGLVLGAGLACLLWPSSNVLDFIRGAALSPGGKPIIALSSLTSRGHSKIVSRLKPGASVTTSRAHVHYVVTEYGVAYLYGKNLRQRASALIAIAHPDHREQLERDAFEIFRRH